VIAKSDAIVLKTMRYGDTSKIVTMYSQKYGKIKCIAKGARTMKSKFGAALEPMTNVALVFYKKENRELHLLSQADILCQYKRNHSDLERMSIGLTMLELANLLSHDEESNPPLYHLLRESLEGLEAAEKNLKNYLFAFEIQLCSIFGYGLQLEHCVGCKKPLTYEEKSKKIGFLVPKGCFICQDCLSDKKYHITAQIVEISIISTKCLKRCASGISETLQRLAITKHAGNEIENLMRLFFKYHFDGYRSLKSEKLLKFQLEN
jgi:DNA repair protein RecO (recombination protein O)